MKKELNKIYNPSDVEEKWYEYWMQNDSFKPNEMIVPMSKSIIGLNFNSFF